jgi:hypothetical protein
MKRMPANLRESVTSRTFCPSIGRRKRDGRRKPNPNHPSLYPQFNLLTLNFALLVQSPNTELHSRSPTEITIQLFCWRYSGAPHSVSVIAYSNNVVRPATLRGLKDLSDTTGTKVRNKGTPVVAAAPQCPPQHIRQSGRMLDHTRRHRPR